MNLRVFDLYVYVIRYACDMHELDAENLLLDLGHLALSVFVSELVRISIFEVNGSVA